jgi:hypothetical protein
MTERFGGARQSRLDGDRFGSHARRPWCPRRREGSWGCQRNGRTRGRQGQRELRLAHGHPRMASGVPRTTDWLSDLGRGGHVHMGIFSSLPKWDRIGHPTFRERAATRLAPSARVRAASEPVTRSSTIRRIAMGPLQSGRCGLKTLGIVNGCVSAPWVRKLIRAEGTIAVDGVAHADMDHSG